MSATGCLFVGCSAPHKAQNVCKEHYRWATRPLGRRRPTVCSLPDCSRPHRANGYCHSHNEQQRRAGNLEPAPPAWTDEERRIFAEEVAWFRSFKMSDEKVAAQFGLTVDAMRHKLQRMVVAA